MARNELINLLKAEIYKYLGIPYFKNSPKLPTSPLNAFVGKGTHHEIATATVATAQKLGVDLLRMDNHQIYNFQKKNNIGIDCSGLAFHLLNFTYQQKTGKILEEILIGTDGKKGVRRLNANLLTSHPNAYQIFDYKDIKPSDLIRMDSGKHVVIIIEKKGDKISYVHSSNKTKNRGVHLGLITITDHTKTLDHQKWTDITQSGQLYSELFNPANGDGIFRLNCLK